MDIFTIASIIVLAVLVSIGYLAYQHLSWRNHTTLDHYLKEHPECATGRGIRCAYCGSSSIRNWGLTAADDHRRVFMCNHCGSTLYRSG
jgi:DNA-directed RNA polymerase subunit RPC12/RpoP